MQKKLVPIIAAAACAIATPAAAQHMTVTSTPMFAVGMQVTDSSGAPVGIVSGMDATSLRVKTAANEVTLPKASFTPTDGKLVIAMTQAQLDAQVQQTVAAATAAVAAGAAVKSSDGTQVGRIDSVADGKVVVLLDSGKRLAVPENGARGNTDGTVTVGYTAAQIASFGAAAK